MAVSRNPAVPPDIAPTDILIIGAGPAGATTALFLAQRGIPHTLLDRAHFPRDKADGNVFGLKVLETLAQLNPNWIKELVLDSGQATLCNAAKIFTPQGGSFRVPFKSKSEALNRNAAFTMKRSHFDQFLVSKLDPTLTHQRFGLTVTAIASTPDGLSVTCQKEGEGETETFQPKLIIGADGANSVVARFLGLSPQNQPDYVDSVQAYFKGVKGLEDQSHFEGYFARNVLPGFFYCSPLADGDASVGILTRQKPSADLDLKAVFTEMIQSDPNLKPRFASATESVAMRQWGIPCGGWGKAKVSGDRALLVGDAACLCNPLTMFGSGNAMASGKLAAEAIAQAVTTNRFDASHLAAYDDAIQQLTQREFQVAHLMKRVGSQRWIFNQLGGQGWVKNAVKGIFQEQAEPMLRL
ncbi:MAG: NAD(P)/FAD-dependent oxidoreductase [Synechococcales cyanobacterium RM1_1_8]|nr:NAD(P)/FAD-dependent oxidoreductase [Synechococcales cyanobacterium RM1_1_8]